MSKLFISTSFSTKVDSSGKVTDEYRQFLQPILDATRQSGNEYFCAVEVANWTMTDVDPHEEFKSDLEQINKSSTLLALVDNVVSAGVQIEIGYMLKLVELDTTKRLILAHPANQPLSWSNNAISKLPGVSVISFNSSEDIIAVL
jgi:hypothetical protein